MSKNLKIHLKIDADTGKLTQVSNGFVKFDKRVRKTDDGLSRMKKQLLGIAVAFTGIVKAKQAFDSIDEDFKTLENAALEVQKTTGLAGDSLKTLTNELDLMAVTMNGFEIEGLYDIAAAAGQLGIKGVKNIAKFTKEMQYMASSSKLTAEESATGFAQLSNVLNVPIDEINKLTGAFSGLAANTTATEGDLLNFTQRLAGAGTNIGLTNSQIIGIGATLKDVGVNFETGGTAISKMFLKMLTDGEKFANVMGISLTEFSDTVKNEPLVAVKGLLTSLRNLDKESRIRALKHLKLDSAQAANVLLKLSGNIGKLNTNLAISRREYELGNATLNEYLVSSTSLEQVQMKNENASKLFGRAIGEYLKPIMIAFGDNSISVMKDLTTLMADDGQTSAQIFGNAIVDMSNVGISSLGFLLKGINAVIGAMQSAYGGYQKLYGAVGGGISKFDIDSRESNLKERGRKLRENDFDLFGDDSNREKVIKGMREDTKWLIENRKQLAEYNQVRLDGEATYQKAVERTIAFDKIINNGVEKYTLKNIEFISSETRAYREARAARIDLGKQPTGDIQSLIDKLVEDVGDLSAVTEEGTKSFQILEKSGVKAGKALSKSFSKAAKETNEEFKKNLIDPTLGFADQFRGLLDGIFSGNFSDVFTGFFTGAGAGLMEDQISTWSDSLSKSLTSAFGGLGDFGSFLGGGLLSFGASMLSGLLSSEASQADIDKATGRVDFSDDSLKNLGNIFESALNPQEKATEIMSGYLKSMNDNFLIVAQSIVVDSGGNGLDLTGAGYNPKAKSSFLGFSSKSTELLGSGISLGGNIGNLDAQGYISELIKKSSFFGLSKSSKTRTRNIDLPKNVQTAFADIMADGIASIITASATLGFSSGNISQRIKNYKVTIGKINLKGLSQQDAQDRINSVFSEIFSGAIGQISAVNNLVSSYAKAGEENLQALIRIATEFDQARGLFATMQGAFSVSGTSNTLNFVKATGGLQGFGDAIGTFRENFFTDTEKLKFQTLEVRQAFSSLGLEMPKNNDAFRELLGTIKDGELAGNVLGLAGVFNSMTSASEGLKNASEDLKNTEIDRLKSFIGIEKSLLKDIASFRLGNLSPFSNSQKRLFAQKNYEVNGGVDSARALLNQNSYTSKQDYASDYFKLERARIKQAEDEKKELDKKEKNLDKRHEETIIELEKLRKELAETRELTFEKLKYGGIDGYDI